MTPNVESKAARPGAEKLSIPAPTVWPASLALAVTLSLWGLASSLIVTAIGLGLFGVSIIGWIGDIRHERRTRQPD